MYEELIQRALGDGASDDIRPLGEGMDSVALLVGGKTVVRIGKTAEAKASFAREEALLPLLARKLDLSIPMFSGTGQDEETGLPWVAYPLIEGAELTLQHFRDLEEAQQDGILDQVAGFLRTINGVDLDEARKCGIKNFDTAVAYKDLMERVDYRLYPMMGVDGQGYIEHIFDRFENRNPTLDAAPVLLHADLSAEHMILDESGESLTGIIDFGDLCIGDPDYEYHWLYEEFGRDFVLRLAERMDVTLHRQFWEKQQTFIAANVLEDTLLLEKSDYKTYRRALESINRGDFSGVYDLI